MRSKILKGETHKKGKKHDGIKPEDRGSKNKKNPPEYSNFQGNELD